MTGIEKHIEECEHRIKVISDSGYSKSEAGKKNITILESAIEACKKQMPMKPVLEDVQDIRYVMKYKCPSCGGKFTGTGFANYCYHCGQKLVWEN